MAFWQKPEFKALQKQWYEKLKAEGFEDAESLVGNDLYLKKTALRDLEPIMAQTKEAYYVFIAQKIQETVFSNAVDHIILSGVAEGKKIRHIVEDLQKYGTPRCRFTVRVKIRTYEMKWGLRQYTPKQLNQKVS